jgi:2-methylaconitate isomerase
MPARSVPVAVLRGGTSRGVFVRADAVPPAGPERDRMMAQLVGSPSPGQIDGLGGGLPTTSKVAVVAAAEDDPDADVHYQVGNVAVERAGVDWRGTCGNLTAAAPVFALAEGLVPLPTSDATTVRLRNLSTGGLIRTVVPTAPGSPDVDGDALISTEYLAPAGSVCDTALPLGARGVLDAGGRRVPFSLVDVTHPYLLVDATAFIDGSGPWSPAALAEPAVAARLELLRAEVAVRLGLVDDPGRAAVEAPAVPRLVLIAPARPGRADLEMLAVSMGSPIGSIPMTAAMCVAAARLLPGTLAAEYAPADGGDVLDTTVGGPTSIVGARAARTPDGAVEYASVTRTSRLILRGAAILAD